MPTPVKWRVALPGQPCQEPSCADVAQLVLTVRIASSEELLCARCAVEVARVFDLGVVPLDLIQPAAEAYQDASKRLNNSQN